MNSLSFAILILALGLLQSGCKQPESDQKTEAPPPLKVHPWRTATCSKWIVRNGST
jgi:hypothetical protein